MSYPTDSLGNQYNPALVREIRKQAPNQGIESALLMGAQVESSMGIDASAWYPGGVPDSGGQSYGPFFFRIPGALQDVMARNNQTQAQAGAWITQPDAKNAVSAAIKLYEERAAQLGIPDPSTNWDAFRVTADAERGTGEENALAQGPTGSEWQAYYAPIVPLESAKLPNMPNTPVQPGSPGAPGNLVNPIQPGQIVSANAAGVSVYPGLTTPSNVTSLKGTTGTNFYRKFNETLNPSFGFASFFDPGAWANVLVAIVMRVMIAALGLVILYFGFQIIMSKFGGGAMPVPIPV